MKEYYGGGSGSDPGLTDCFETTYDHYVMAVGLGGSGYSGSDVVAGYDAEYGSGSGNGSEDGGVDPSNYNEVMDFGATLNNCTAHTSSGTAVADYFQNLESGSGSGSSAYQFDAMGVYNDPNGTDSHMVNITGMHKDANGVWEVDYIDYQNNPGQTKHMPASEMIGVTSYTPIGSGSGSGN